MAITRRSLFLGGIALPALLLFGCSLLLREEGGVPGSSRYIRLNVGAPAARGMTVSEYAVTGLEIEPWDPQEELLDTIAWHTMEWTLPVVYAADQQTILSAHWDVESPDPRTVELSAGQEVYIVIDSSQGGGTYSIGVFLVAP